MSQQRPNSDVCHRNNPLRANVDVFEGNNLLSRRWYHGSGCRAVSVRGPKTCLQRSCSAVASLALCSPFCRSFKKIHGRHSNLWLRGTRFSLGISMGQRVWCPHGAETQVLTVNALHAANPRPRALAVLPHWAFLGEAGRSLLIVLASRSTPVHPDVLIQAVKRPLSALPCCFCNQPP